MASSGSIGSLSIDVLANIASMVSDLGRAQAENAKAAREFQAQWKEATDSVGESFRSLAELAGVTLTVGGLVEIGKQALESAEKVTNLSAALGFSTQTLQTAGYAAALVGADLETASAAMAKLNRSAVQAASGNAQEVAAFQALGISAGQVAELLKKPDELLQTVAEHAAELGANADKTAAIMQIFGRGAAAQIPFLNELGEHFQELHDRAEQLGIVLSSQDQAALTQSQEGFNELGQAVKGAGNLFTIALLPAITAVEEELNSLAESGAVKVFFQGLATDVSQFVIVAGQVKDVIAGWVPSLSSSTSGMKSDFVGFVQSIKDGVVQIVNHFENNWELLKGIAAVVWAQIQTDFNKLVAGLKLGAAEIASDFAGVFRGTGMSALAADLDALAAGLAKSGSTYQTVTADLTQYGNAIKANNLALESSLAENQRWADGIRETAAAAGVFATTIGYWHDELVKGDIAGNMQRVATATEIIHGQAAQMIKDGADRAKVDADEANAIQTLTKWLGEADKATATYNAHAKAAGNDGIAAFAKQEVALSQALSALSTDLEGPYAKAWETYSQSFDKVEQFLGEANVLYRTGKISIEEYNADVEIGRDLQAAYALKLDQTNQQIQRQADVGGKWLAGLRGQIDGLEQFGSVAKATTEVDKLYNEALQKNLDLYGQAIPAGRTWTEVVGEQRAALITTGAALIDYRDNLKAAKDLAKQWADTFAGDLEGVVSAIEHGESAMQALGNLWKTVVEQMIEQAIKLAVIGPIVNSVFGLQGSSALPTGNIAQGALGQLFGGSGGGGNWLSGILGGGAGSFNASSGLGVIGSSDELGLVPNYLGGASESTYGAVQAGGGSFLDSLGGVSGVTAIVGGALAGWQLGSQLGGTAGGIAGAAALGYAAWAVPVVGWIAGAASLINTFTGGGLFGTKFAPYGAEENFSVGAGGGDVSALIDEKKKKALFGGTAYKTVGAPVDQATQDAFDQFFAGLQQAADSEAQIYGEQTGQVVAGTFHETFDKAGKVLTQESTIAGKKFSETLADFQAREFGDTLLANMGAASAEAQKIAEQWQSSAATLLAGAQFLAQAQLDITRGNALVQGDTLTQLTEYVQGMAAQGESLIQTYVRLSLEVTDVVSTLNAMGLATSKTGEDLVTFSDDMVKAAGGLQNLNTLWNDYYNNFFSDSERQANKLKADQEREASAFSAIGQDPTETMQQFRDNFTAVFDSLSPADVIKWLAAAEAMSAVNADLGTTAVVATSAAESYQKFIDTGLAELGKIEADAASVAAKLFGTGLDQLKAQRAALGNSIEGFPFAQQLDKQIAAQEAQQEAAQHLSDASQLLRDFAYIGAVSGQSLAEIAKENSVPLDLFAQYLGTNAEGLEKQFETAEKSALAALDTAANTKLTAELLADIYAAYRGQPQPYDTSALDSASSGTNPAFPGTGKPTRGGVAPAPIAGTEVVAAVTDGNHQAATDMAQQNAKLDRMIALLEQLVGAGGSSIPPGPRRTFLGMAMIP